MVEGASPGIRPALHTAAQGSGLPTSVRIHPHLWPILADVAIVGQLPSGGFCVTAACTQD